MRSAWCPEVPNFPAPTATHMWLSLPELLTWNPQSDVAKPYPPKAAEGQMIETALLYLFAASALAGARGDARRPPPDARRAGAHRDDARAGRHLRPPRRPRDRGVPGADLRRRGDGVHGVRDHADRRERPRSLALLLRCSCPASASWCSPRCSRYALAARQHAGTPTATARRLRPAAVLGRRS